MNASQSMTVARRLSLGFGLIILVLIAMVTVTLVGLSTINQQIYEITQINALQGRLATKMVDSAQEMRVQYRQLLLENDPAKKKESAARLSKARETYLKAETEIKALFQKYAAQMSASERDLMSQLANQKPVAFASIDKLVEFDTQGKEAEALAELNAVTSPQMAKLNEILRNLADEEDRLNDVAGQEASAQGAAMRWQMIIGATVGIVLSVVIALLVIRSILNTLGADPAVVKDIVERVAQGDFTVQIDLRPNDRTSLLASLSAMVGQQREVLSEIRLMSSNLFSASEQLSSTATGLASGAAQQAASVEETSASIEEMSATINQNTDNAKVADGIASKTAGGANDTGKAVDNMVHAMKEIAGRITMIDDIANKTDLLAINAAIEAARAGEHGKGFATVAVEVRKLAERSQVAAREIGELASRSVGTAEKAGSQLTEMLPGIDQTATLVQEIAAGSREQATGIRQINQAMTQISQTMQNAAASSEELSATAEEVSASASQLQNLLEQFNLGNGGRARNAAKAVRRSKAPAVEHASVGAVESGADDDGEPLDAQKFTRF